MIRQHNSGLSKLMRFLDGLCIVFGMLISVEVYRVPLNADYLLLVVLGLLGYLLAAELRGMYKSWPMHGVVEECVHILVIWFGIDMFLLTLGFITETSADFSRLVLIAWMLGTPAAICLFRLTSRWMLVRARGGEISTRVVAFAGVGGATKKMIALIESSPWLGLKVIGVFDDRKPVRIDEAELRLEGDLQSLLSRAHSGEIDIVYITLPMIAEKRIIQIIEQFADTTVSVFVVPDLFLFSLYKASWVSFAGIPVISTFDSPFYGIESWVKRLEDLVLGGLILLMISPLLLIIAIGVKMTSPGDVIFKQRRYGLKGDVVEVWKFRSMTVCDNGDKVVQAKKNDIRITPFGAFLRRTSLDELPQFINVLQGTMSIVGPRPHAVAHNEQYRKQIRGYMLRHKVKPGITGLAQISGYRGETDTLDKMQGRVDHDLEYIQNWSLWFDVKIIAKTILVGFIGKNVH